jgi:Flp pilus assembly pilin Flp
MKLESNDRGFLNSVRAFHEDEDGMEALQVVMILAIGAIILMIFKLLWPSVGTWVKSKVLGVTTDSSINNSDLGGGN